MQKPTPFFIIVFLSFLLTNGYAQDPSWSINSGAFEYSMTVTAVLKINDALSNDTQDRVAAFVNGEIRGVGTPSFYQSSYDAYVVYLQVYSNKTSNETVTFKIYDASEDAEVEALNSISFKSDQNNGTTSNPYVITNNNAPAGLSLSITEVDENLPVGTVVGAFNSAITSEAYTYTLISGTGDENNGSFYIEGNQLKTNTILDFETNATYSIRVQTANAIGGTLQKQFTITIRDTNDSPEGISLSNNMISEGEPIGTSIGTLTASDVDASDTHTFSLVSGNGDADNGSFTVEGPTIKTLAVFDYETKPWYSIRVQAEDNNGGTYSKAFTIFIRSNSGNSAPILLDTTFNLEHSASRVLVGMLAAIDPEHDDLSYAIVDGNLDDAFDLDGEALIVNAPGALDFNARPVYELYVRVTDGILSDTAVVKVNLSNTITSTENPSLASALNVYPNPVVGNYLYLMLPSSFSNGVLISVIDIQGKVYSQDFVTGTKPQVRLPDVSGLLMVKIENGSEVIYKRILR